MPPIKSTKPARRFSAPQREQIEAAISEHLKTPLRLCDIAGALRISRYHFARRYRVTYGESLRASLLRRRIELAQSALAAKPKQSLTALALRLGFHDLAHFSRTYRKIIGHAPCGTRKTRKQ